MPVTGARVGPAKTGHTGRGGRLQPARRAYCRRAHPAPQSAFGVGALLMERGPGFIADFGTAEGVARLLTSEEIAWVAWLHILAFDQVIGLTI